MSNQRTWATYPATYRTCEIEMLAGWIAAGESSSVVGLPGCGRSNLLAYLCQRADVLQRHLPHLADQVIVLPVELDALPAHDLAALYRTLLHAFYWERQRFPPAIAQAVNDLYLEHRAVQDAFLTQKAVYELFSLLQRNSLRVVLVLNRFDRFCATAPLQLVNALRSLRDHFKHELSFIAGMLQEVSQLPDPTAPGNMAELLDSHVCWVTAMTEADARYMLGSVLTATAVPAPQEDEVAAMLRLSGRFPSLLKAVAHWWLQTGGRPIPIEQWCAALLEEHAIQFRLERIWQALTQAEKVALTALQKRQQLGAAQPPLSGVEQQLGVKGLCHPSATGWQISSQLIATYVARRAGQGSGKLWVDEPTRTVYQGQQALADLTALQYAILHFLLKNPYTRHTRDAIIDYAWPEEDQRAGITPNALQVHIASIRKIIEPNPADPRYLRTWHGKPGGYQFFPEGKPE